MERTRDLQPRADRTAYPGPIPYQDPKVGLPNQQDVTSNIKHFGLNVDKDDMKACLVDYGSDRFYDSWDGNVCGGLGWFKGAKNDHIDPYDCYQTCASWVELEGIGGGAKDYQCDFERGTKGHCWMGYHPVESSSTSIPAAPQSTGNSTGPIETE